MVEHDKPRRRGRGGKGRKRPGVFSRASAIRHVDGRTVEAKIMAGIVAELTDQLGGPERISPAQRLLVHSASVLAFRLRAACERYVSGDPAETVESLDRHVVSLAGALSRTLQVLGLERVEQRPLTLTDYLAAKRDAAA